MTPMKCPSCAADLQGDKIPEAHRSFYVGSHFSRVISIYDRNKDAHDCWKCPDCEHEWKGAYGNNCSRNS